MKPAGGSAHAAARPASAWRPPTWCVGVFALALVVRLGVVAQLSGTVFAERLVGDGQAYEAWGRRIAGGEWIGRDPFFLSPLYAYVLGVLYALAGPHLLLVRVLQAVLGAATCALVGSATARLFDRRAGLAAGAVAALYAPLAWMDVSVHKTALEVFFTAAFLALAVDLRERRGAARLALCGAVIGCLALTRENAIVLLPITALWLLLAPRIAPAARWRAISLVALGFAALMAPVVARSRIVTGEWATTFNLGSNFYIGNHAGADGLYDTLIPGHGQVMEEARDVVRIPEEALHRPLRPSEASRWWLERGLADVRADPAGWLALLGRKALLLWNDAELMDTESFAASADESSILALLGRVFRFGVVVPLAALGLWVSRGEWRRLWFLHLAILALAASITLFYVFARYRISMVVLLLPFTGLGVATLRAAWSARRWSAGAGGVLAPLAVAVLVWWPLHTSSGDPRAATWSSIGGSFLGDGQPAEAIVWLRKAVEREPDEAVTRNNLGVALKQTGDLDGAIAEFRAAVRVRPEYSDAHLNLSVALGKSGDASGALAACREALRLRPDFATAHSHLGTLLFRAGDTPGAIAAWKEAARLDPDDVTAPSNLGAVLAKAGDIDGAIAAWRAVLRAQPDHAVAQRSLDALLAARKGK